MTVRSEDILLKHITMPQQCASLPIRDPCFPELQSFCFSPRQSAMEMLAALPFAQTGF